MIKLKNTLLILLAVCITFSSLHIAINPKPVQADSVTLADPSVPQNKDEEVAWWVDRTLLILFNNSQPANGDTPPSPLRMYAEGTGALIPGTPIKYGSDANACKISVTFKTADDKPTSGTFSGCDSSYPGTVRLEKTSNAKFDGYYKNPDFDIPFFLNRLTSCGSDGRAVTPDTNSYNHVKESSNRQFGLKSGRFGATWMNKESEGGTRTRVGLIADPKKTGDDTMTVKQIAYCPSGRQGVGGYGSTGQLNDNSNLGRTLYIKNKTTQEVEAKSAEDAAGSFQKQKLQQKEFFDFFSGKDAVLKLCAASLTGTYGPNSSPATLKQYAIDTLIRPIPGPFSDCLRKAFENDEEFNRIDSIVAPDAVGAPNASGASADSCSGGPPIIGELFCWITEWVFDTINSVFSTVIEYFSKPPGLLTGNDTSTLQNTWANLRNIANVIFILAFLFVIFQYMTNYNVADAYFIKKFVPRLVVAVILTQASGWITQELAFFFQDLGSSIQSIVFWAGGSPGFSAGSAVVTGGGAFMVGLLLSGGGFALIGVALIVGLVLLIVLIITIFILVIRQILLILLAIFAPLAFACLAIPQLEGLFKKWIKMYIQLLFMYPFIMLMIAAASLLSSTLSGGDFLDQIIGLIVQFLPFILLPFTFKFAGSVMGNISGKLQGMATKKGKEAYGKTSFAQDRAAKRKATEGERGESAQRRLNARMASSGRMGRFGRRITEEQQEIARARQKQDDLRVPIAKQTATKAAVDAERFRMDEQFKTDPMLQTGDARSAHAKRLIETGTEDQQKAAFEYLVGQGDVKTVRELQTAAASGTGPVNAGSWNTLMSANYGELKAMDATLVGEVSDGRTPGLPPTRTDLDVHRVEQMRKLDAKSLAGQKADALGAYHDALQRLSASGTPVGGAPVNADEAKDRVQDILTNNRESADLISKEKQDKVGI